MNVVRRKVSRCFPDRPLSRSLTNVETTDGDHLAMATTKEVRV